MSSDEMSCPYWFAYRDQIVCWLEPTPFKNVWCPHVATNPVTRRRCWAFFDCWKEFQQIAVDISEGPGLFLAISDDQAAIDFFEVMGFTLHQQFGFHYFVYGGAEWGKTQELSLVLS